MIRRPALPLWERGPGSHSERCPGRKNRPESSVRRGLPARRKNRNPGLQALPLSGLLWALPQELRVPGLPSELLPSGLLPSGLPPSGSALRNQNFRREPQRWALTPMDFLPEPRTSELPTWGLLPEPRMTVLPTWALLETGPLTCCRVPRNRCPGPGLRHPYSARVPPGKLPWIPPCSLPPLLSLSAAPRKKNRSRCLRAYSTPPARRRKYFQIRSSRRCTAY